MIMFGLVSAEKKQIEQIDLNDIEFNSRRDDTDLNSCSQIAIYRINNYKISDISLWVMKLKWLIIVYV